MDTPGGSRSTTSVEVSNPDANPDKLDHAAEPRVGYAEVGKVEIYYEVRGSGIPVLMIGAATEDAEALRVRVDSAVHEHLRSHPDDWAGATEELGRAAASSLPDTTNLFSAPPDKEWFARRTGDNAESLIRGVFLSPGRGSNPMQWPGLLSICDSPMEPRRTRSSNRSHPG